LATGSWPAGVVRARNGDDDDLRPENLILTKAGPRPFDIGKGGEASSLARRAEITTRLISALSTNPGATVPMLSRLVGSPASCICTRLGKLSDMGLTCGPRCDARARWELTAAGKDFASASSPLVIDDLDREILSMIAGAPLRQLELARRVGVASLTIKRRVTRLIDAGMVAADRDRRFRISGAGVSALGGPPAPKPVERWIDHTRISAANSKDVIERVVHRPFDDRTSAMRSAHGTMAAAKGEVTMRLKRRERLAVREADTFEHFDRLAG
jgi:Winged helix-turn-helix DNA-binding